MYTPGAFEEKDPSKIQAFVRQYPFGLLISRSGENLHATHLPFLLKEKHGPQGELISHMARANSQWEELGGKEVLGVFQGPHAYISPAWYEAENVVPTWNYVAVHAYGIFRPMGGAETKNLLLEMTDYFEAPSAKPWKMGSQSPEFLEKIAQGVMGFKIEVNRWEGKWKLSQNHPQERRERVIRELKDRKVGDSLEIARLMEEKETT